MPRDSMGSSRVPTRTPLCARPRAEPASSQPGLSYPRGGTNAPRSAAAVGCVRGITRAPGKWSVSQTTAGLGLRERGAGRAGRAPEADGVGVKDEASAARVERMKNGMRADQVAQLAVALCADGAKDTTGQIFAVRGNEVFLFNQPRPVRAMARLEGWTPQSLIDQALPAMKASYTDVGASASVFPYDPV